MVTEAQQYGAVADHDAVPLETAGARLDDAARDKLASSIEGSLAALGDDSVRVTPQKPADEEPVKEFDEELDEKPVEEPVEEPDGKIDGPADETEAADKGKGTPSTPTLPVAYRRSLKAYGWEDEEIEAALANNPEQFTSTALRIHRTRNEEISKFAEVGRQLRTKDGQDQMQPDPGTSAVKPLHAINVEALIEKYGNEEIVMAMAAPMNAAIAEMQALMPEVRASVASAKRTQQETLGKAIDTFFQGTEMVPYEELYGKPGTTRMPEQVQKFHAVLELADAIIAGAAEQGRRVSFEDAMESAHADVSKDHTQKVVRSGIKKTVKTRSKSLSLKPSHGGDTKKADSRPTTRKELEAKTKAALANVFS